MLFIFRLTTFVILLLIYSFSLAQLTSLVGVSSWAYQLQNISVSQIAADPSFELVVMDYSSDGSDDGKFSNSDITSIKNSGKQVISYISIGEAEDYRFYWQPSWSTIAPSWLGPENPDWAGNYKVRYWDPQWQGLIFNYVDTIISQGFDGIYLDIVDAWYYWTDENPEEPMADSLMIDFISKLRLHVDNKIGDNSFIILPQNGEDVLDGDNINNTMKNSLFTSVNGIGVEDVLYPGNMDENNAYSPDAYRISLLDEFQSAGKPVFSIEYLTDSTKIQQYQSAAATEQYIPYYCMRELDQLCQNTTPTVGIEEKANSLGIVRSNLYDLSGRMIHSVFGQKINTTTFELSLAPGIYLLKTTSTSHSNFEKVLVIE